MADFVPNISKGRVVEFYNRVKSNDPANSAFIWLLLATTGLEADDVLRDADSFAAMVSGTTNEATNTGYGRQTVTDVELAALPAPDDTNNRFDIDIPNPVFASVQNNGTGGISKIVLCYDNDTTAGTDSSLIPVGVWDFVVTPDGTTITGQVATAGFYRAS